MKGKKERKCRQLLLIRRLEEWSGIFYEEKRQPGRQTALLHTQLGVEMFCSAPSKNALTNANADHISARRLDSGISEPLVGEC